jgi:hypothetical protein
MGAQAPQRFPGGGDGNPMKINGAFPWKWLVKSPLGIGGNLNGKISPGIAVAAEYPASREKYGRLRWSLVNGSGGGKGSLVSTQTLAATITAENTLISAGPPPRAGGRKLAGYIGPEIALSPSRRCDGLERTKGGNDRDRRGGEGSVAVSGKAKHPPPALLENNQQP